MCQYTYALPCCICVNVVETVKSMEDIETLEGNTKTILFDIIDTYLRDAKARKAYAH